MITAQEPQVTAEDLWSIVAEVWESVLGGRPQRVDHAFNLEQSLTSSVEIHGDWEGLVTFTCPSAAAHAVARTMHQVPDDAEVPVEDVHDAIGEIANIVGGQVKSLCAGDNTLGLPRVGAGLATSHAQQSCRAGVEWAGHVARVAVWRSTATAVGPVDGGGR